MKVISVKIDKKITFIKNGLIKTVLYAFDNSLY